MNVNCPWRLDQTHVWTLCTRLLGGPIADMTLLTEVHWLSLTSRCSQQPQGFWYQRTMYDGFGRPNLDFSLYFSTGVAQEGYISTEGHNLCEKVKVTPRSI